VASWAIATGTTLSPATSRAAMGAKRVTRRRFIVFIDLSSELHAAERVFAFLVILC
jgi:hypothetical protein